MKEPINMNDVDIDNILVSSKCCIGEECFKYVIGYINHFDDDIKPLFTKFLKLTESIKSFEKRKFMSFMITKIHEGILQEYDGIWNKVKDLIGKKFGIELICEDKHIAT